MFGAFRPSSILNGGLVWKSPYRLSATRKANLRHRLKRVDSVIAAVAESGVECRALSRALELPKESEMLAKDKYTTYDPKYQQHKWRKGVHKVPKWTKLTLRTNPKGF